jgi:acetyltransferase-like isoleucine patch superfamily enzyme
MKNSFYSEKELLKLGFKKLGKNCLISKKASFYNIEKISLGNNVRIDDFCILSGEISIGSFVHISAFCGLYGAKKIKIGNYSGLSPRCTVFSAVDDFSGEYLINPMIPEEYTNVTGGMVKLGEYVQLGANSIVMPNITIGDGSVCGAFTFVNKNLADWKIYTGIPAVYLKPRKKTLLKFVEKLT